MESWGLGSFFLKEGWKELVPALDNKVRTLKDFIEMGFNGSYFL